MSQTLPGVLRETMLMSRPYGARIARHAERDGYNRTPSVRSSVISSIA